MRAAVISRQGTPVAPNVQVVDQPEPEPGPGQMLVRTEGSALNQLDLWVGRGLPNLDTTWPFTGGCDGCGTVDIDAFLLRLPIKWDGMSCVRSRSRPNGTVRKI